MTRSDRHRTVLVVEDEPSVGKLIQSFLQREGMRVDVLRDGRSALQYLETRTPDLICLDLVLPEVSGYDVCDFVRKTERLAELPVLMITARSLPADRAYAEEVGVSAYLTKPFSRAQFMRQVDALMAGRPVATSG